MAGPEVKKPAAPAKKERGEYRRQLLAPILVLAVFILVRVSGLIDSKLTRESEHAAVILLEILIFMLPSAAYLAYTRNTSGLRIRLFGIGHLLLILSAVLMTESGSVLLNCLTGGYEELSRNYDLWGIFISKSGTGAADTVYIILAYALLPAICEEFVFRAVLCREYERRSIAAALFLPALFFAMLHFDIRRFPAFFLAGTVFAITMYASRSVLAAVAVNFFCNLISLFSKPYMKSLWDLGGEKFFFFLITAVFLLFGFVFFAEAARLYRRYAAGGFSDSYREMIPPPPSPSEAEGGKANYPLQLAARHPAIAATLSALLSPTALLCYIFFAAVVLLSTGV